MTYDITKCYVLLLLSYFFHNITLTHENFRNRHSITNLLIYSLYFCSLAHALYTQPKNHLSSDRSGGTTVVPVGSAQKLFSLMALDGIAKNVLATSWHQFRCITICSTFSYLTNPSRLINTCFGTQCHLVSKFTYQYAGTSFR